MVLTKIVPLRRALVRQRIWPKEPCALRQRGDAKYLFVCDFPPCAITQFQEPKVLIISSGTFFK
jgi:hypothetical protein